jgi:hypothetical protein
MLVYQRVMYVFFLFGTGQLKPLHVHSLFILILQLEHTILNLRTLMFLSLLWHVCTIEEINMSKLVHNWISKSYEIK